jgi:hypothetical protein
MFMTHHRFAARLQTQYQTSRFEGVRREAIERYRFGIALSKLKQHPIGRGPDLGTSLAVSDQVRESPDGLSRPPRRDQHPNRSREQLFGAVGVSGYDCFFV